MEGHKHSEGGACGGVCVNSHSCSSKNFLMRILLGVLLLTFVFCAGMLIGRIDGASGGRYHRGNMYKGGYGYRMMEVQPMLYPEGGIKATTPATAN